MARGIRFRGRQIVIPFLAALLVAGSVGLAVVASLDTDGDEKEEPAPAEIPVRPPEAPREPLFIEKADPAPVDPPEESAGPAPEEPGGEEKPGDPGETEEGPAAGAAGAVETPPDDSRRARARRERDLRRRTASDLLVAGQADRAIGALQRDRPDAEDRATVKTIRGLKASGRVNTYGAALKALRWLVAHRDPKTDGFHNRTYGKVCGDKACRAQWSHSYDPGVSALALMALNAFRPLDFTGEFKEHAFGLRGHLAALVGAEGRIGSGTHYNEAIVALALLESRAWESHPVKMQDLSRKAARRLIRYLTGPAQIADGGWRYRPEDFGSDTSVTCWVLQALIEAQNAGIQNLTGDIQDGLSFVEYCTDNLGWTGYTDSRSYNPRLTAAAVYVRFLANLPKNDPRISRASRALLGSIDKAVRAVGNSRKRAAVVLEKQRLLGYGAYYLLHAASRLGGPRWNEWGAFHRGVIIETQEKEGHLAGSWAPDTHWGKRAGPLYLTAIHALALMAGGP